ncbi:putative ion transporter superfamily protein YfcC [Paenibacillus castaneae]|nr:hypothetical protein [Paenibacillus castaneae]NIK79469.1 putative ion transporter superfamily protein YfcC [Paenibacillus castaneae]
MKLIGHAGKTAKWYSRRLKDKPDLSLVKHESKQFEATYQYERI